jgi:hypothetical protein
MYPAKQELQSSLQFHSCSIAQTHMRPNWVEQTVMVLGGAIFKRQSQLITGRSCVLPSKVMRKGDHGGPNDCLTWKAITRDLGN